MKRDLDERLRKFAKRILRLASALRKIPDAHRIADQIARSGPSIGLNYAEAQAASSLVHFITIVEIAEREARETQAALEMIIDQEYVKPSRLVSLYQESSEIVAILNHITFSLRSKGSGDSFGKLRTGSADTFQAVRRMVILK